MVQGELWALVAQVALPVALMPACLVQVGRWVLAALPEGPMLACLVQVELWALVARVALPVALMPACLVQAVLWALAALLEALMVAWVVQAMLWVLAALPVARMRKLLGARSVAVGLRALVHRMALLVLPTREQGLGSPTVALVIFADSMIEARLRESCVLPW